MGLEASRIFLGSCYRFLMECLRLSEVPSLLKMLPIGSRTQAHISLSPKPLALPMVPTYLDFIKFLLSVHLGPLTIHHKGFNPQDQ